MGSTNTNVPTYYGLHLHVYILHTITTQYIHTDIYPYCKKWQHSFNDSNNYNNWSCVTHGVLCHRDVIPRPFIYKFNLLVWFTSIMKYDLPEPKLVPQRPLRPPFIEMCCIYSISTAQSVCVQYTPLLHRWLQTVWFRGESKLCSPGWGFVLQQILPRPPI